MKDVDINYLPNQRFLNPEMEEIVEDFRNQIYKTAVEQVFNMYQGQIDEILYNLNTVMKEINENN